MRIFTILYLFCLTLLLQKDILHLLYNCFVLCCLNIIVRNKDAFREIEKGRWGARERERERKSERDRERYCLILNTNICCHNYMSYKYAKHFRFKAKNTDKYIFNNKIFLLSSHLLNLSQKKIHKYKSSFRLFLVGIYIIERYFVD